MCSRTPTTSQLWLSRFAGQAIEVSWGGTVGWEAWGWSSSDEPRPQSSTEHRQLRELQPVVAVVTPMIFGFLLMGKLTWSGKSRAVHCCPMSCALQGGKILCLIVLVYFLASDHRFCRDFPAPTNLVSRSGPAASQHS